MFGQLQPLLSVGFVLRERALVSHHVQAGYGAIRARLLNPTFASARFAKVCRRAAGGRHLVEHSYTAFVATKLPSLQPRVSEACKTGLARFVLGDGY
jgi:hypothetical protein